MRRASRRQLGAWPAKTALIDFRLQGHAAGLARHPRFTRPYTDLVYQPMLELMTYLRANGLKTFIVSGGTVEFMRAWAERVYGIPPEQVVGTTFVTKVELRPDSTPGLVRARRPTDRPKASFVVSRRPPVDVGQRR